MSTLHICNTQFEWEWTQNTTPELFNSFLVHPNHIQFQFLPFLYADASDYVLLTHQPDNAYWRNLKTIRKTHPQPLFASQDNIDHIQKIESWGFSPSLAQWAKKHNKLYEHPPFQIVKQLTSKQYVFEHCPRLANSTLIKNTTTLHQFLDDDIYPKVLKTSYGHAGRGHKIIPCKTALHVNEAVEFCKAEWKAGRVLIGEPWMTRDFDFSSQWSIGVDGKIQYLGYTEAEVDQRGTHRSNTTVNRPVLDDHHTLIQNIQKTGYFGPVGMDGFSYQNILHPINEINPRKTMGFVALALQHYLQMESISLRFLQSNKAKIPALPSQVVGLKPFKLQLDLCLSPLV